MERSHLWVGMLGRALARRVSAEGPGVAGVPSSLAEALACAKPGSPVLHIAENQPGGDPPARLPVLWIWELSFVTVHGPTAHRAPAWLPHRDHPGG